MEEWFIAVGGVGRSKVATILRCILKCCFKDETGHLSKGYLHDWEDMAGMMQSKS